MGTQTIVLSYPGAQSCRLDNSASVLKELIIVCREVAQASRPMQEQAIEETLEASSVGGRSEFFDRLLHNGRREGGGMHEAHTPPPADEGNIQVGLSSSSPLQYSHDMPLSAVGGGSEPRGEGDERPVGGAPTAHGSGQGGGAGLPRPPREGQGTRWYP